MMGAPSIVDVCLTRANGDPAGGLVHAVRVTRWKLIIAGKIEPPPDESLPVEVRRARRDRQDRTR